MRISRLSLFLQTLHPEKRHFAHQMAKTNTKGSAISISCPVFCQFLLGLRLTTAPMPLFLTATAIMMAGAYFASTDN
jgi:hypothetical protein